ncbi:MAG TPA: hypothetical protein PL061_13485 [Syntrophales bacterium]|nr:hypothetical protein [Syntrophales bacterium]
MLGDIAGKLMEQGLDTVVKMLNSKKINEALLEATYREAQYNKEILRKLIKLKKEDTELRRNLICSLETKVYDDISASYIPFRYIFKREITAEQKEACIKMLQIYNCLNKSIKDRIPGWDSEKELIQLAYHKIKILKNYSQLNSKITVDRYKNILALLTMYAVQYDMPHESGKWFS